MAGYERFITKNSRPYLESLRDDLNARKDPDFFQPTGTQVYCGVQGSGKTVSAVKHLIELKERYPKAILVTNIKLTNFKARDFNTEKELAYIINDFNPQKEYIVFSDVEQLEKVLTLVNNGKYGVIYIIDEIHTYFNSIESKNIPMWLFAEISQQRKQRKLIIGTSQLFTRMAKPLREQCDNIIMCRTIGGIFTKQVMIDGMSLEQDFDGSFSGTVKKKGWFFHKRSIREAFDTFQKIVSTTNTLEFEQVQRPQQFEVSKATKRHFRRRL